MPDSTPDSGTEIANDRAIDDADGAAVLHDEDLARDNSSSSSPATADTDTELITDAVPWSPGPWTRALLPPTLDAVSTDEIDGEDDPLERSGRVGGEEGTAVVTITPLCFWLGDFSLIWRRVQRMDATQTTDRETTTVKQ